MEKSNARKYIDVEKREPLQKWVIPDGVNIVQDDGWKKVVVVKPKQYIIVEMIYRTKPTNFLSFPGAIVSRGNVVYYHGRYNELAAMGGSAEIDLRKNKVLHGKSVSQLIIEKGKEYQFLKKEFPFNNKFPTSPLPEDVQIKFLGFCDDGDSAEFEIIIF